MSQRSEEHPDDLTVMTATSSGRSLTVRVGDARWWPEVSDAMARLPGREAGEDDAELCLERVEEGWCLSGRVRSGRARLHVDFSHPRQRRRLLDARENKSPLGQALGRLREGVVWDLTAGLGRDAFSLASRGFSVEAVEVDPVVGVLLCDAQRRLGSLEASWGPAIADRVRVHCTSAEQFLAGDNREPPAVIYLDPMFEGEQRKSEVKKDLALLRMILPSPAGSTERLVRAVGAWLARVDAPQTLVVVKRPKGAQPLWPRVARRVKRGAVRYDIHRGPWGSDA